MKRTERINREREKLIGHSADGKPIWTEVGGTILTMDQKVELSARLAAKQRYHDVQVIKTKVQEAAAGFFESVVLKTAPERIVDDYFSHNPNYFVDWLVKSGYRLICDGFHAIVIHNGEEIARTTAKVPAWCADEVLVALRVDQMIEKGSNGGH